MTVGKKPRRRRLAWPPQRVDGIWRNRGFSSRSESDVTNRDGLIIVNVVVSVVSDDVELVQDDEGFRRLVDVQSALGPVNADVWNKPD